MQFGQLVGFVAMRAHAFLGESEVFLFCDEQWVAQCGLRGFDVAECRGAQKRQRAGMGSHMLLGGSTQRSSFCAFFFLPKGLFETRRAAVFRDTVGLALCRQDRHQNAVGRLCLRPDGLQLGECLTPKVGPGLHLFVIGFACRSDALD